VEQWKWAFLVDFLGSPGCFWTLWPFLFLSPLGPLFTLSNAGACTGSSRVVLGPVPSSVVTFFACTTFAALRHMVSWLVINETFNWLSRDGGITAARCW